MREKLPDIIMTMAVMLLGTIMSTGSLKTLIPETLLLDKGESGLLMMVDIMRGRRFGPVVPVFRITSTSQLVS